GTRTAVNNTIEFVAEQGLGQVSQSITDTKKDHVYYIGIKVKTTSDLIMVDFYRQVTPYNSKYTSGTGEFEYVSFNAKVTLDGTSRLRIIDYRQNGWDKVTVTQP